jgi:hypothetical protein
MRIVVVIALAWFFLVAGATAVTTELDAAQPLTGVPPVCSTDAECEVYDLERGIVAWT